MFLHDCLFDSGVGEINRSDEAARSAPRRCKKRLLRRHSGFEFLATLAPAVNFLCCCAGGAELERRGALIATVLVYPYNISPGRPEENKRCTVRNAVHVRTQHTSFASLCCSRAATASHPADESARILRSARYLSTTLRAANRVPEGASTSRSLPATSVR